MAGIVNQGFAPIPLAASGLAKTGAGLLGGIIVGTSTALTIKVWDSLTATGTVILETTVAITSSVPFYLPVPAAFNTGCFVTIGGTGTVTVLVA